MVIKYSYFTQEDKKIVKKKGGINNALPNLKDMVENFFLVELLKIALVALNFLFIWLI